MTEAFLSYVWQYGLFDIQNLQTNSGETVTILSRGVLNRQSGPDFFDARIQIGDTLWAGNVELHVRSSDWLKHEHQKDPTYDNVILHVVNESDVELPSPSVDSPLPCLSLQGRIAPHLFRTYNYLQHSQEWIPCRNHWNKVDPFILSSWLNRLLVERLEEKVIPVIQQLQQNYYHWETTFYQLLARAFGSKFNATPFEQVARSLPMQILAKHKNNLLQLEALLFGQAGLLHDHFEEEYPEQLYQEYTFLQKKYQLRPLNPASWKFGGLRPPNFPTLRLAQFSMLIHQSKQLFSRIIEAENLSDIITLLETSPSDYWTTHYILDKPSAARPKNLGPDILHSIVINTVVPILFAYAQERGQPELKDRALQFLEQAPPEKNSIVEGWRQMRVTAHNAFDSQALLQLKNQYCETRRCLSCAICHQILQPEENNTSTPQNLMDKEK